VPVANPPEVRTVRFRLNGDAREVEVRPGEMLLETLRNRCGILSTKDGCQPQGQCGCCLAIIDGRRKTTCAVLAEKAEGADILTLEGVDPSERDLIARSFVAAAGLQCGFCIPGIALQAKGLLDRDPNPSRRDIARALNGHLCRCTGYTKILDAIELFAAAKRGEAQPVPESDGRVGRSLARWTGAELVLGDAARRGGPLAPRTRPRPGDRHRARPRPARRGGGGHRARRSR
jgi:xanthine dehydrogenase molybdenum-binding subunit